MPEQPAATRSGLFTTSAVPVPLTGVSIDGEISGFCARVAVTQRYVNRETTPIEAVYVFPLDEGAAVCGFEAIIDGTIVIGEVKEREEAFRAYDDAMERGDGAFLLDEERPDIFQASIGNLLPGKEVLVKLIYVTELNVQGPGLRFSIPTTVSPRYAPAADQVGVGRPDSETLNPPVSWRVPYGLELSLRLAMTGTISRIESPSHPVSVVMNDSTHATVSLSRRDTALDRDFVLTVDAEGLDRPHAWLERDDEGGEAMAVAFVPRLGSDVTPGDITFLVDRSGSMAGTSIEEVRNALQLCLRSMISGCRFNIVGFGSTFQTLFPESRAYDEASLAAASAHVGALQADLGGTEILPALQFVLQQARERTLARQIVVLTDGEVTNTDAVLELTRKHAADARVFTFGIGAGASHHLVNGLARTGGGASELIFPGERIEPKVVRQFGRLLSPALTDIRVNWGTLDVTPATSAVPPVFSGERLLVYGFAKRVAATATVALTANGPSGPVTFDVSIDPARIATGRTVATLAARTRIRELEEGPDWLRLRGSQQRERAGSRVRQEIIALATRYGLVSRETSFVAIERRENAVKGDAQLRRVPIALTNGWGGIEDRLTGTGSHATAPARLAVSYLDSSAALLRAPDAVASRQASGGSGPRLLSPMSRLTGTARNIFDASTPVAPVSPLHALVALQRADGSWTLTAELASAIGRDLTELVAVLDGAKGNRKDAMKAWATALALAWLHEHAQDAEDQWRLLAAKARRWLDTVPAWLRDGTKWMDAATAFLAQTPTGNR
jgi:Ca-activated chloride channel family protein